MEEMMLSLCYELRALKEELEVQRALNAQMYNQLEAVQKEIKGLRITIAEH